MLAGGVMGIVLSGDLFNIYVMLEVMTFAAVGLTAFRTWNPNAREAAFKYLVVGSIGSTCVLLGTALVYAQCHTLNLAQISALLPGRHEPDDGARLRAALHRLRLQELHVPLPPDSRGRPRRGRRARSPCSSPACSPRPASTASSA